MQNNQEKKIKHSIKNTQDVLKDYYNGLQGEYQGYIQLSDRRIEHIFKSATKLPEWESLHDNKVVNNYILELALFEPITKKSILVRQTNEKWLVIEKILKEEELEKVDTFFTVIDGLQAKIAQV